MDCLSLSYLVLFILGLGLLVLLFTVLGFSATVLQSHFVSQPVLALHAFLMGGWYSIFTMGPYILSCRWCNVPVFPSLWSLLFGSTMTLCVYGPPSSHWTAMVDPAEKDRIFLNIIFHVLHLQAFRASYCASWLPTFIGSLLICGRRSHMGLGTAL